MAKYKTHSLFNLAIALPLTLLGLWFLIEPNWRYCAVYGGFFAYATLFMSPDMDLANQIKLFSLRGVLTLPFRVYAKFFSHRGLSHSALFGTLTRLLCLVPFVLLGLWSVNKAILDAETFLAFLKSKKIFLTYGLGGVFIADLSHLLLDL